MKGKYKKRLMDFPDGPVVKTLCFQDRGHGFYPCQGTKSPHASKLSQKNILFFFFFNEGGQGRLVSKSKVILGYSSLLLGVGVEKAISCARFPFLREKEAAALE